MAIILFDYPLKKYLKNPPGRGGFLLVREKENKRMSGCFILQKISDNTPSQK